MTHTQLRIEFFGHFTLRAGAVTRARFSTHKVAVLLARLAYQKNRQFGREEIIEMLWPDSEPRAGRVSLRTALTSLRRQLEPPGASPVLVADHTHICLNPEAFTTDAAEFQDYVMKARMGSPTERERCLQAADTLYQGELLPGFYEDWILQERSRLAQIHTGLLMELCSSAQQRGDLQAAVNYVSRCLAANPLEEEAHTTLMNLLLQTGRRHAAQEQYARMWQIWEEQLGEAPPLRTRQKAQEWQLEPAAPRLPAPKFAKMEERAAHSPSNAAPAMPELRAFALEPPAPKTPGLELPLTLTRLFGREEEIGGLCDMLQSPGMRLLTLTGMGGVGKTRLAIEVARQFAPQWSGRIVFVPLADVMEADRIPDHILSALHTPPDGKTPVLAQITRTLQAEPTLLLLDNFEHLLPAGVDFLLDLLHQAPTLQCFVTSRHRLDILGEHEVPLAPLAVPKETDSPETLMQCPSVQLLLDRARFARPDFQITIRNCRAVAALCQGLEGLPLALELTAARVQMMTVGQMLTELQRRLEFLVSRKRNLPLRHRSLHATLDWSYGLLTPELKRVLTRLSVFRGGWQREAAEAVCETRNILFALDELMAASLMRVREEENEAEPRSRYSMLEVLREFAFQSLSDAEQQVAQGRHLDYFLCLAESAEPELRGPRQSEWFAALEKEHANFQVALTWAAAELRVEAGLRLTTALWYCWSACGHRAECRHWLETFLAPEFAADLPVSRLARAAGLYGLSNVTQAQGDYDRAEAASLESLTIYREAGNATKIVACLNSLATLAYFRQDYTAAVGRFEEVIALARAQKDDTWLGTALMNLATTYGARGEYRRMQPLYEEAICLCIRNENRDNHLNMLVGLAGVYRNLGDYRQEQSCTEEAMQLVDWKSPTETTIWCLLSRGQTALMQGDSQAAARFFEDGLQMADRLSNPLGKGRALRHKASVACLNGDYDGAEQLYADSLIWTRQSQNKQSLLETWISQGHLALRRGQIGQAESLYRQVVREWKNRQDSPWLEAALCGLADCCVSQPERAVRLLAAAAAMRERMGTVPARRLLPDPADRAQSLKMRLGEADFQGHWGAGFALSCASALQLALE